MTWQVGDGNTNEVIQIGRTAQSVQVGGSAATTIGFHGATPVDQTDTSAAVSTSSAIAVSSGYGFATSAQADAVVTLLNACRACLREHGLMA